MATLDDLFTEIRPLAPAVPVITLRRAIRTTLKKFCQESFAWKVPIVFPLVAEVMAQDITALLPTTSGIYAISEDPTYTADGKKITRSSPSELDRLLPNWRNANSGRPAYCYVSSPTTISFATSPSSAENVDINLICMPLLGSNYIDDDLLENYWDALSFGALSVALNNPGAPWYDPSMVAGYAQLFQIAVEDARKHSTQTKTSLSTTCSYGGI